MAWDRSYILLVFRRSMKSGTGDRVDPVTERRGGINAGPLLGNDWPSKSSDDGAVEVDGAPEHDGCGETI